MQPTSVRAFQACNASSHTRKLGLRLFFHTSSLSFLFSLSKKKKKKREKYLSFRLRLSYLPLLNKEHHYLSTLPRHVFYYPALVAHLGISAHFSCVQEKFSNIHHVWEPVTM